MNIRHANDNYNQWNINDRVNVLNQWKWSKIVNWKLVIPTEVDENWEKIKKIMSLSNFDWWHISFWTNPDKD